MSVPRRVLRPGLTWPIVVGRPRNDDSGRDGGSRTPEERQRELKVTGSAEGSPIPAIYGRMWVGGRLILIGRAGNDIVLAYVVSLALNGIESFEQILIDGKTNIPGVTVRSYIGTHTTVPTDIAAAYPSHVERYKGLSLVTLRISPDSELFGGLPEVRCLIKGRKIWNGTAYAYSANPALIAYDILTAGDMGGRASGVDWASFNSAASFFAARGREFAYNITEIENSLAAAKRILEAAEGRLFVDQNGIIKAAALRDDSPALAEIGDAEIITSDGVEQFAQVDTAFGADSPNLVVLRYQDADRNGEEAAQYWKSPWRMIAPGTIATDDFHAPWVTSAVQAARLAEDIGLRYLVMSKAATVRVLEPRTPGDVIRLKAHGFVISAFSSDASGITVTGATSEPTTEFRIAAYFMLSSASGGTLIRHGTPGTDGFELSVTSSGATLKVGSAVTTLAIPIPIGVPIRLAVGWKANDTTVRWSLNGLILRSSISAVSSASAGTNSYVIIPGFSGELCYIHLVGGFSSAGWVAAVASSAPSLGGGILYILGDGTANRGTISGGTITKTELGLPFWVSRCKPMPDFTYELELREWQPWSRADAQVFSTNDIIVQRYDSKPSLSLPDHSEVPPPPSNLQVQANERQTSQGSQYEISVSWAPSPSTFVRGYRVYCSIGGIQSRLIGEYGRNANGCQFWAFAVGVQHIVTVTAVSNIGKESTGISASVTPGTSALAVTNLSASWIRKQMGIKGGAIDKWYTGGILTLSWSVTGQASQIIVEIADQVVARLAGSARSLEVARGFVDGMWAVSGFGTGGDPTTRVQAHFDQGATVRVTAIAADGRNASASATIPAPSSTNSLFHPFANEPLIGDGSFYRPAQMVAGYIGSAPTADSWSAILCWERDQYGNPATPRWRRIALRMMVFSGPGSDTWTPGGGANWMFFMDPFSSKSPTVQVSVLSQTSITISVTQACGVRLMAIEV